MGVRQPPDSSHGWFARVRFDSESGCGGQKVHPRSNVQGGDFSETFDDPALPGWEHSTEAQVEDGVLRIQPGGFAAYLGMAWEDLTLTVRARQIGAGGLLWLWLSIRLTRRFFSQGPGLDRLRWAGVVSSEARTADSPGRR
jgi:hypothetical protein